MACKEGDNANGSSKPTPPAAHPRDEVICEARQELSNYFHDLISRHDLTLAEAILLLSLQTDYIIRVVLGTERTRE